MYVSVSEKFQKDLVSLEELRINPFSQSRPATQDWLGFIQAMNLDICR